MNSNAKAYKQKLSSATSELRKERTALARGVKDIQSKLKALKSKVNSLEIIEPSSEYKLNNPDENSWFDSLTDAEADSMYNAWADFNQLWGDYDEIAKFADKIQEALDKLPDIDVDDLT